MVASVLSLATSIVHVEIERHRDNIERRRPDSGGGGGGGVGGTGEDLMGHHAMGDAHHRREGLTNIARQEGVVRRQQGQHQHQPCRVEGLLGCMYQDSYTDTSYTITWSLGAAK